MPLRAGRRELDAAAQSRLHPTTQAQAAKGLRHVPVSKMPTLYFAPVDVTGDNRKHILAPCIFVYLPPHPGSLIPCVPVAARSLVAWGKSNPCTLMLHYFVTMRECHISWYSPCNLSDERKNNKLGTWDTNPPARLRPTENHPVPDHAEFCQAFGGELHVRPAGVHPPAQQDGFLEVLLQKQFGRA